MNVNEAEVWFRAMMFENDGECDWPKGLSSYEQDQITRGFSGAYVGPFGGPLDVDEWYELGRRLDAWWSVERKAWLRARRAGT